MAEKSDLRQQRRSLIDMITYSRARSVRIALFGEKLYRGDPEGHETPDDRDRDKRVLRDTLDCLRRTLHVLEKGVDPRNEVPVDLCRWAAGFLQHMPQMRDQMRELIDHSQALADAVDSNTADIGVALRQHNAFRKGPFLDTVGEFCNLLWADIDRERAEEIERANTSGKTLKDALNRLESIGKHVRLVSLNASVEAARVGDAGRGLGVISVEFKRLAEEIQDISKSAHEEIAQLTVR